jgi:hypothetical protein
VRRTGTEGREEHHDSDRGHFRQLQLGEGEQVELCGALLCGTAGCVKCHCCLFIASCRWNRALLCDTAGCVMCYC